MTEPAALTWQVLLKAYRMGVFPMAESRDSPEVFWVDPRWRGILPLDGLHVSRSLARQVRRGGFEIGINEDFGGVVAACADRPETWINDTIFRLYNDLHARGHAHSLEVRTDGRLVGGIYGVAIGAAFFGESMFSRISSGSKIALVYLVDRLRRGGFRLFDTQFVTPHLRSMGGREVARDRYRAMLAEAVSNPADFAAVAPPPPVHEMLQRITQTS